MKKINHRTCIVSRKQYPKDKLLRIAKFKSGEIKVDVQKGGRGVYILRDESVLDKLVKYRLLNRTFRIDVSKKSYEEIIQILKEEGENVR